MYGGPVTFDDVPYYGGQNATPTYTIVFSGSDGKSYTMKNFNFSPYTNNEVPDAVVWEGALPPGGTVLTVTPGINPTRGNSLAYDTFATCFCDGTLIDTLDGPKPVEHPSARDRLCIQGVSSKEILRVFSRSIGPGELRQKSQSTSDQDLSGALGADLPARDTWLSRQHRFRVSSATCAQSFGRREVLVSAIRLTRLPGVFVDENVNHVRCHHILMRDHEMIFVNGAATESLCLGKMTLNALPQDALEEVYHVFSGLRHAPNDPTSAHAMPSGQQQKRFMKLHTQDQATY